MGQANYLITSKRSPRTEQFLNVAVKIFNVPVCYMSEFSRCFIIYFCALLTEAYKTFMERSLGNDNFSTYIY